MSDEHYSYRLYVDPAMADRFDAMRFSGPIGTLLAESQDAVIASFLGPLEGRTVLDVGTGTGRAAIGLARRGARVTGVDASAEMLRVAKARAAEAAVEAVFEVGTRTGWRTPTARSTPPSACACSCTLPTGGNACPSCAAWPATAWCSTTRRL